MSIKNKLVTAVTTAGLLAGLFGSAFVPVAQGAGRTAATVSPKASLTVLSPEADLDDATAGGTSVGFLSADSDIAAAGNAVAMKVEINSVGNNNITVADLKAVSSNDEIQLAWLYTDGGVNGTDCSDMDSVDADAADPDLALDNFTDEDIITSGPDADAGVYWLCFAAAEDDTAAVSTVTVYAQASGKAATEGYVLLKTLTVTAIGPVDTINLAITDGYRYVAEENDHLDAWLTIKCYDERGVLINDKTASISEANSCGTVTEDSNNPKNNNDIAFAFITNGTVVADAAPNAGALQLWDLDEDTCNEVTGDTDLTDAGSSFALKVAVGTVKSNAVTITCTTNSTGVARVTKVTAEATTGLQVYNETATGSDDYLSLYATVVDENGLPLGDGSAAVDFDWSIDGATAITSEFTDGDGQVAVGGEIELGTLCETIAAGACTAGIDFGRLGNFTYSVTAADSDLAATTDVEVEYELSYLATGEDATSISQKRNAAKTRATITADMGESNAFERVEFFVELANGSVKTYVRRANASGVVSLVQVRRNTTVYVYADLEDGGGSPTDVIKVVFK